MTVSENAAAECVWIYSREQVVGTFRTRLLELKMGSFATAHSRLYTLLDSKSMASGSGHDISPDGQVP